MIKPNYVDSFDFYQCKKCGRLITHIESLRNIPKGKICPCGSLKFGPIDPKWFQYFLPRVMWFAVQRMRGLA